MHHEGAPGQQGRFRGRSGLDAWIVVHRLFNLFSRVGNAILQPLSLSNDELVVLICLANAGDALPVGQITSATLFEPDRLRRAADKLEARRLVTRSHQPKDRRKVIVRMEEDGQQLLDSVAPALFQFIGQIIDTRGPQDAEFLRAKIRKVVAYAGTHERAMPREPRYDTRKGTGTVQTLTGVVLSGSYGRPRTWGLAAWLRAAEWSNHADRIWRRKSHGLGLTAAQLQVLAVLAEAGESLAEDAIARITGLSQDRTRAVLTALDQTGFVRRRTRGQPCSATLAEITERGKRKVMKSLSMANSFAEELWQGLSDDDVERVLSLLPKFCAAAERAGDAPLEAREPSLGEVGQQ